jgi:hypothetical protein
MQAPAPHADARRADTLALHAFAPAAGAAAVASELYEDAGDGYAHERGEYRRTTITAAAGADGGLALALARTGRYAGARAFAVTLHGVDRPGAVTADGRAVPVRYDAARRRPRSWCGHRSAASPWRADATSARRPTRRRVSRGQLDGEGRAGAGRADDGHVALHAAGERAADRQAEPVPSVGAARRSCTRANGSRCAPAGGGDADAGVAHVQAHAGAVGRGGHRDRAAAGVWRAQCDASR